MAKFRISATGYIDIDVVVEAETAKEALEIAEDNIRLETYSNDTVGVDYWDDDIEEVEVSDSDYIDWNKAYIEEA